MHDYDLESVAEESMAVSNNKLKILYIMKALLEESDEEHVLSSADLSRILQRYGLSANRKTIYSDIETLREFGLDILQNNGGNQAGYYIGSREFELPELKLLVDAVQVSKFITSKKSEELIEKLEKLASRNDAKQLRRNVFIYNRPKTGNETIYYNVDQVHNAILRDKKISFQYTEWTVKKELISKKDGLEYIISPWALTWDNQNYYLIAYEEETDLIKHYRVDKMRKVQVLMDSRLGKERFQNFDLASFAKKTFGMYGGQDAVVTLLCHNTLAGVMIDRFGRDIMLIPEGEEHFRLSVQISVSPQFFGWITGLGSKVHLVGPENVQRDYCRYLERILDKY